jgi:tryptophan synthase alpha chain
MKRLSTHLQSRKEAGHKLLVPYVMADSRPDWLDVLQALANNGADAIEVGIAFSDPVMDGPVIQDAGLRALEAGSTPNGVFEQLQTANIGVPLAVMTYFNLVNRAGLDGFANRCVRAGVSGTILPDLPFHAAEPWMKCAAANELDNVCLVAPNTSDERMAEICAASSGFVYAVGTLGVTGARNELAPSAALVGQRAKKATAKPVLIGIGVSTPDQAGEAVRYADGVVVGSAIVRECQRDGSSPADVGSLLAAFRAAVDGN